MRLKGVDLRRIILIMLVGSMLGFAMLTAVFCLPVNGVVDPQGTAEIFRTEGNRPSIVPSYLGTTGDNYTDALMIAEAIYAPESISPLEQAVYICRLANSDSASVDLADMLEGKEMQWEIRYTRYWHGFLVLLRPLLMIFSYADLRVMMCMTQMLLFSLVLVTIARQGRMELIIPFIAMILTIAPLGAMPSLQYFAAYVLMLLGVLAVLWLDAWLGKGGRYGYFFLLQGMLTCYFDFLTYPLVTLFIPLALAIYLHLDERGMLKFSVGCCFMWGMGYAGFWAMKWVVGSLLVGEDLIYNAYHHAKYQVSMADVATGNRLEAVVKNISVVCRPAYAVLYLSSFAGCLLLRGPKSAAAERRTSCRWLLAALSMVPFVWWLIAVSHSVVHALFTYRLLSITVFALLLWLISGNRMRGHAA